MEFSNDETDKEIERKLDKRNSYVLSLLKDKKRLLVELDNERKLSRKWKSECCELKMRIKQLETGQGDLTGAFSNCLASASEQANTDHLSAKVAALERNLLDSRAQINALQDHKAVLEAELVRLAESMGKGDSSAEVELAMEQLCIFEDDFKKERNDKEKAETQVSALTDQVLGCQDLISRLTREVDLYKNAFEREKRDKEMALLREKNDSGLFDLPPNAETDLNSIPGTPQTRLMPAPHLQVVYPIVDARTQQQDVKRKQELHRRGFLARNWSETTDFFCDDQFDVNTL